MNLTTLVFIGDILDNISERLTGPAHFRFIVQPLVAIILGIRDGIRDAKTGKPPYIYGLVFHSANRTEALKGGFKAFFKPLVVTVLMDAVVQYFVLTRVSLIGAVLVGGILIAIPYTLARALTNRIFRARYAAQRDVLKAVK